MADDFGQAKTFAPTPRRREAARKQGHVALSLDLTNSVQLVAGVVALWCGAGGIAAGLLDTMRVDLSTIHLSETTPSVVQVQFLSMTMRALELIGFVIGLLVVSGLGISMMQTGFHITPELLAPRWDRIAFSTGWERTFSRSAIMRALMSVLKVLVVAAVAAWVLRGKTNQVRSLSESNLGMATAQAWSLVIRLALAVAAALALIGALDYLYQRWRLEQSLMMTAQEMKEQLREDEGDPQTKARLRRLAREATKSRQMKDVPSATVVV